MHRILVLLVVALLGLTACGAGEDADSGSGGPAESTEPEPTALPDVARVVCDESGARLETSSVRPQPDGIHFEIVNETGSERSVAIQNAQGTGTGMGVPAGTSTQVVDVEPGALTVSCTDPATEPGAGEAPRGRRRGRHLGLDPPGLRRAVLAGRRLHPGRLRRDHGPDRGREEGRRGLRARARRRLRARRLSRHRHHPRADGSGRRADRGRRPDRRRHRQVAREHGHGLQLPRELTDR